MVEAMSSEPEDAHVYRKLVKKVHPWSRMAQQPNFADFAETVEKEGSDISFSTLKSALPETMRLPDLSAEAHQRLFNQYLKCATTPGYVPEHTLCGTNVLFPTEQEAPPSLHSQCERLQTLKSDCDNATRVTRTCPSGSMETDKPLTAQIGEAFCEKLSYESFSLRHDLYQYSRETQTATYAQNVSTAMTELKALQTEEERALETLKVLGKRRRVLGDDLMKNAHKFLFSDHLTKTGKRVKKFEMHKIPFPHQYGSLRLLLSTVGNR